LKFKHLLFIHWCVTYFKTDITDQSRNFFHTKVIMVIELFPWHHFRFSQEVDLIQNIFYLLFQMYNATAITTIYKCSYTAYCTHSKIANSTKLCEERNEGGQLYKTTCSFKK